MKYIVEINEHQAERIKDLISKGKYRSVAQFISVAIENHLHLEESEVEEISLVEGETTFSTLKNTHFLELEVSSRIYNLLTVPFPSDDKINVFPKGVSVEKSWLWGQVNRVFPVKIGIRVLCTLLKNQQWIDFEEFREKATEIAAQVGDIIKEFEKKANKKRDDRISAGLPSTQNFKSKMRYKAHFLAYLRGDGKIDGALGFLKFINIEENGSKPKIGVTEQGLEFARILNPVIDQRNFEYALGEEEVEFYITHVKKFVKGEFAAIKWLLNKLANGPKTREWLNEEIFKEFGKEWGASENIVNTQRSGLIGRMYELGLIEKYKEGIKVSYALTQRGKGVLLKS